MKKMKRILSLVLVLVMAAGLAACGGGGTSGAGSSTPAEPAGSQGSGEGYELTMWLFQDWTVGTAAEIFNTWADEYIAQHPEVKASPLLENRTQRSYPGLWREALCRTCLPSSS